MYDVRKIYDFLVNDFETLWDIVASQEGNIPRGNYTFALKSMIFLEFISRVCSKDSTRLISLAQEMDSRYFAELPISYSMKADFHLPYLNCDQCVKNRYLLLWLFAMIRHGTAHYYHQIRLNLGEFYFEIGVTGPKEGCNMEYLQRNPADIEHLKYRISELKECRSKLLTVIFNPALFFLDLKRAVQKTNLIDDLGGKPIEEVFSVKHDVDKYRCKMDTLVRKLRGGGLQEM